MHLLYAYCSRRITISPFLARTTRIKLERRRRDALSGRSTKVNHIPIHRNCVTTMRIGNRNGSRLLHKGYHVDGHRLNSFNELQQFCIVYSIFTKSNKNGITIKRDRSTNIKREPTNRKLSENSPGLISKGTSAHRRRYLWINGIAVSGAAIFKRMISSMLDEPSQGKLRWAPKNSFHIKYLWQQRRQLQQHINEQRRHGGLRDLLNMKMKKTRDCSPCDRIDWQLTQDSYNHRRSSVFEKYAQ